MRRFNDYNGTVTVPLLARIVLFLAFFFIGGNKLFQQTEFDAAQAERLRELGATVVPIEPDESSEVRLTRPGEHRAATPVALPIQDHDEQAGQANDAPNEVSDEPIGEGQEPADDEPEPDLAGEGDPDPVHSENTERVTEPIEQRRYLAAVRHSVTLRVDKAGWPFPIWQARLVATIEMVGGALLLIGLFSRLWGLLLAGTMVGAFCLVSIGEVGVHQANPFNTFMDVGVFNMVAAQLALFVLAFGILLTGPGPVSVDRLIFRGQAGRHHHTDTKGPRQPAHRSVPQEGRVNLE